MASGKLDITVEQGATFSRLITIKDASNTAVDISTDSFAGQIRKRHQSAATEAAFSFTITNGSAGQVTASITNTVTAAMDPGDFVYDIEWTSGSTVTRLLEGTATVTPEVTR
jgi:hypothetical protein|tara:strand:- start:510 stop:845 length:336 start_codon:yes stop_codon:yes gene_type:complete